MYIRKGYKDMIKNLIFDVGGVLFDYRWKEMFMDYGLDEDNAIRVGTQMFNDPDITKVLIICDRVYAQKANNRTGGVEVINGRVNLEKYGIKAASGRLPEI